MLSAGIHYTEIFATLKIAGSGGTAAAAGERSLKAPLPVIGARAGGYVLVTRRHQTRLADVRATAARLAPTGAVALGAVVND